MTLPLHPLDPDLFARALPLLDDEWLTREEAGNDVGFDPLGGAYVLIDRPRIYSIARTRSRRVLKLSPESPGVTFHSLVFEAPRPAP